MVGALGFTGKPGPPWPYGTAGRIVVVVVTG